MYLYVVRCSYTWRFLYYCGPTTVAAWNQHYNYHRFHAACHYQRPVTRLPTHVSNIVTSYTWR